MTLLDLFTIRRYDSLENLKSVLAVKRNGKAQPDSYVEGIVRTIVKSSANGEGSIFPMHHFNTRKAIEMWPKEVYRASELFPLDRSLRFGPLEDICGPRAPVLLLERAFGEDCFDVYYQSAAHNHRTGKNKNSNHADETKTVDGLHKTKSSLPPLLL